MKYIDADRLRAEIERLKEGVGIGLSEYEAGYHNGAGEVCNEILSVIDSLQQEQPDVDLEKASRNVYESWMGGTMNDVRRDMVELGKVLNARKEESK